MLVYLWIGLYLLIGWRIGQAADVIDVITDACFKTPGPTGNYRITCAVIVYIFYLCFWPIMFCCGFVRATKRAAERHKKN